LHEYYLSAATKNRQITVPLAATTDCPKTSLEKVTEGRKPLREAAGILRSSQKGRIAEIEVGSGSYQFSCPIEP